MKNPHAILLVAALACAVTGVAWPTPPAHPAPHETQATATNLRAEMRRLWHDHVAFTRDAVISMLADLPDRETVTARLLKNQDEIGDAIKPFYGEQAGNKLAGLLREHILLAADIVLAAKANDSARLAAMQSKWRANGDELALFLAGANAAWQESELQSMLARHLELLSEQIAARLRQDWKADIAAYDEGETHMLMFADSIANGLIQQFST